MWEDSYQFIFAPIDAFLEEFKVFVGLNESRFSDDDSLRALVRFLLGERFLIQNNEKTVLEKSSYAHVSLLKLHNSSKEKWVRQERPVFRTLFHKRFGAQSTQVHPQQHRHSQVAFSYSIIPYPTR